MAVTWVTVTTPMASASSGRNELELETGDAMKVLCEVS